MKRIWKWLVVLAVLSGLFVGGLMMNVGDVEGARAKGERLERMARSERFNSKKKRFFNELTRVDGSFFKIVYRYFFAGSKYRLPQNAIHPSDPTQVWKTPPRAGLRVTWLGHSTFFVEIDGVKVLVDPVWSERASPFSWAGPKRFYAPPVPLGDMPDFDAVIISHDHYDHLDRHTVGQLRDRDIRWIAPLGLGAHLEHWGVQASRITELDWWDSTSIGDVKITATPARHFSGRSILFTDQDATLWAGWAWNGPKHSVFYSGDTGMHPEFKDIGDRLGPFDVTLMETGAYSSLWTDVHLGPEQAVLAHQLVRGRVMLPVHWGLFDLALHSWTEPVERVLAAAARLGVSVGVLKPGSHYDAADAPEVDRWWPEVPWDTFDVNPVWSTGVDALHNGWTDSKK